MNKNIFLPVVLAAGIFCVERPSLADDVSVLEKTGSAFARIAESALPAVVFVDVETTVEVPRQSYMDPFEDFFGRRYYRRQQQVQPRTYNQQGQGSGFLISKDGYILTNNHVVGDADRITVTLADGRKFEASLVGSDPKTEVALIRIEDDEDFPYLELGDSDAIRVGEWVLAAGSPFGLSQTITSGIVSAKERSEIGITEYGNFIQTDAAINPGNSGGPLLNIQGKVVGINTAIISRSGGYMGIGFAIPINQAAMIKDQLIEYGKVSRSVLGVAIQPLDDENLADSFGMQDHGGILIAQVMPGSAAEEAGLQEGDIVVEMNERKTDKIGAFRSRVASLPPGSEVTLKVFRNGEYVDVKAVTQDMDAATIGMAASPAIHERLGIAVENLDSETAKELGYQDGHGVVVTEVEQGSPAWRGGLRPGVLIVSVNRELIESVEDFVEVMADLKEGSRVLFLVNDGRSSRFVVVTLDD